MLVTLVPLFDKSMKVSAYSLFSQKKNFLLNPALLGTGQNDGAAVIDGLEVIQAIGIDTLSPGTDVFVPVSNIAIFSDIESQCRVPHERLVLLFDNMILNEKVYIDRLSQLKLEGYKLAIRKLPVSSYETSKEILNLMNYIIIDSKKVDVKKAKIYFGALYPKIKICAGNLATQEIYDELKDEEGLSLFEGDFYRIPVTKGQTEIAPLKANYIELLNMVNDTDFELTRVADVIGRDTALVLSLLEMVNRFSVNSEITSIRHAAAMLGQRELKKWINTIVTKELCADRPSEVTRISLLRAKFAEMLAPLFGMEAKASELFLMGLFSVLDLILNLPMDEALKKVNVSKEITEALVSKKGDFANVLDFMIQYEAASWQEVSRMMILQKVEMNDVYDAYLKSVCWYRDLVYTK
ncbi:MAG: HDOD domain-containing protein [Clostridia bacterium]|nr:HDOD domain-containing protein [Clostridia bacterium]